MIINDCRGLEVDRGGGGGGGWWDDGTLWE